MIENERGPKMHIAQRAPRPLGQLTAAEQHEVDYGWQTLQLAMLWLHDEPCHWLRYHVRHPAVVWRLLRLLWCCLVVTLLAEPADGREL